MLRHHFWSLVLASCAAQVKGHGYVYWPSSRGYLKNNSHMHSQLAEKSGVKGMKTKWKVQEPMEDPTQWAHDLCGNAKMDDTVKVEDSWKNWAGAPVATYKQGGEISFTVVITAEHGGRHEFRLCPKQVSGKLGSIAENAKCIDSYLIGSACTPTKECGCYSDKCSKTNPHRDPKDPLYSHGHPRFLVQGSHVFKFKLPKDVHCDQCTVQWFWMSAFGEPYKNCMDIKIEKGKVDDTSRRRRRRRRKSTTPAPTRRRRRKSTRRRAQPCKKEAVVASANPHTPILHGQKWVDMEYEHFGCFPLVEHDEAAKNLAPTADTLRDLTCMKHASGKQVPCRSGLPFYRLQVHKEAAVRLCFSFCSSRGLDLFGLVGDVECRCGATEANDKLWDEVKPHSSLLLDHDTKLEKCDAHSVNVFRYSGWMKYHNAVGVQDDMLDMGEADETYIKSIVSGEPAAGVR